MFRRLSKRYFVSLAAQLTARNSRLELRPPVMELKFTVNGSDIIRMNTHDLYLALKYAGYGANVAYGEWYELLGLDGTAFVAGDKSTIELSVRETDLDG